MLGAAMLARSTVRAASFDVRADRGGSNVARAGAANGLEAGAVRFFTRKNVFARHRSVYGHHSQVGKGPVSGLAGCGEVKENRKRRPCHVPTTSRTRVTWNAAGSEVNGQRATHGVHAQGHA